MLGMERNPIEGLDREKMLRLTREAVIEAHTRNPNALGVVIHGSRANEGITGDKQPRIESDLDIITIRKNGDDGAIKELVDESLWKRMGKDVLLDTGPWGSLEWEEILTASESPDERERFRRKWKHLGANLIIVGATPEIEDAVEEVLRP